MFLDMLLNCKLNIVNGFFGKKTNILQTSFVTSYKAQSGNTAGETEGYTSLLPLSSLTFHRETKIS